MWELRQTLRPKKPGLSCGSPSPGEAGEENLIHACPTFLLPFTPPDTQGLKVSPRDLGEKALTRAWDTASSRFAETGWGQDTLSASAPSSQHPLLNTHL